MNKKEFATKILKCSPTLWCFTLKGRRNLGFKKAKLASQVLNTDCELWINPDASVNDRKKAWVDFCESK